MTNFIIIMLSAVFISKYGTADNMNGITIVAAFIVIFAGAAAGLVTGIFHTLMGIPAILSGILTQLILWSVNLKIMGQANQVVDSRGSYVIVSQLEAGWAILIMFGFLAVIIGGLYWFFGTEIGSGIRATGNNPNMSRAQGINVSLNKIIGLMISNALVALAGALLAQYQGFADINMGRGAIVIGLAAVIIGEAIVTRISRNFAVQLSGVILGGIIYYIVYQFVIWLNLDTEYLKMFSAIVVAIFLAIPYWKKRYFGKFAKKRPPAGGGGSAQPDPVPGSDEEAGSSAEPVKAAGGAEGGDHV